MRSDDMEDMLGDEEGPAPAKPKKAKKVKSQDPKKPSKAVVTKPGKKAAAEPAPKKRGRPAAKEEPAPKKSAKKANGKEPPKAKGRPKTVDDDVSTVQPDDNIVLKAVRKLKEPTMASQFASTLGVHRRVIRAQLQRLSKDKSNGVSMKKDGFNWLVANTQK